MNAFKPGSPRRLAHSRTILACLSTLPLLLVSGLAQAQFNFPICCIEDPFPRTTDENVAVGELSRMLPSAGIQRYTRYVGNFRWQTNAYPLALRRHPTRHLDPNLGFGQPRLDGLGASRQSVGCTHRARLE